MLRSASRSLKGSLSLQIGVALVAIFLVVDICNLLGIVRRTEVLAVLGLSFPGVVQRFWFHQFVTSPLLHASLGHVLFNTLSLFMLGPGIETVLGRRRYAMLSIVCGMVSMLGFLLVNWGKPDTVVGYSGVLFGLMVATAIYFPNSTVAFFAIFPMKMKHAMWILGMVELYYTVTAQGGHVANSAHLFGALAAWAYLRPPPLKKRQTRSVAKPPPRRPVAPSPPASPPSVTPPRSRARVPREL